MVLLPLTPLCSLLSCSLSQTRSHFLSLTTVALEVEFHSGGVAGVEVRVQVVLPQDLRNELVAAAATRPLSRLEEAAEPQVSARDFIFLYILRFSLPLSRFLRARPRP